MSHYNLTGCRQSTPDRDTPLSASRGHFQDYARSGSPFDSRRSGNGSDFGGDRQRNLSGGKGIGGFGGGSRPSSVASNRSSSGCSSMGGGGNENGSSRYPGSHSNGSATLSDRIPRTRIKLSELPTFRESLRSYSPTARRTGEDILNDLKEQMRRESDTFFNSNPETKFGSFNSNPETKFGSFNSNPETKFGSFGRKNMKDDIANDWPTKSGMDDMRNRGHHVGFPRMANWMSADNDGGMADLSSRMAQVPNWPLSLGRRGGPFRERRGSGGSAMSATSEDDSSYDPVANDKSSQGSGGSGGLDAVSHEIPIMIEAEAPPLMMQQQQLPPQQERYQGSGQPQQYQDNGGQNHHQQQVPPSNMSGPVPPLVGQVRKSPQYATRTTSAVEGGNPPEQPRATRCASAPPQMIDQTDGPNARFVSKATVTPQSRSATVPLSPHNNVAKPFVSTFKSSSPRAQDPIMEENFQHQPHNPQQQQEPQHLQNNQQQHHPQQQPDQNVQQHPQYNNQQNNPDYKQSQQQWSDQQPYYNQPQQAPQQHYQEYEQPGWRQFYADDPRGYDQDHFHQPQPQQQHHQRSSVVRNIPIFIEGQDNPIINEEKAPSLSSSPRNPPQFRQPQPQQHHPSQFQQDPYWNPDQYFRSQSPFANQPTYQPPQQPPPNQQYYQHQQQQPMYQPQPAYQQQPQQQYYQQQQPHQKPQPHHHQQPQGAHEIPIQTPPQQHRQPSPQPQPPPVKLTPLQKIDQVRANNNDFMKQVDEFKGNKKDREFLYLDEMLTRALISLDDIDPDGNDEIRQARRALIKDINSKIALLEKKASSASPAPKESSPTPSSSSAANGTAGETKPEATGTENGTAVPAQVNSTTPPEVQSQINPTSGQKQTQGGLDTTATSNGKADGSKTVDDSTVATGAPGDQAASTPPVPSSTKPPVTIEAIPCPAPAIPLPEK